MYATGNKEIIGGQNCSHTSFYLHRMVHVFELGDNTANKDFHQHTWVETKGKQYTLYRLEKKIQNIGNHHGIWSMLGYERWFHKQISFCCWFHLSQYVTDIYGTTTYYLRRTCSVRWNDFFFPFYSQYNYFKIQVYNMHEPYNARITVLLYKMCDKQAPRLD